MPITSWITFAVYSIWTIVLLLLVISRRKHQPVRARSPLLMGISLLMTAFMVLSTSFRLGFGRETFPCALYAMVFSMMQPWLFLPNALRAWRLLIMYRMSASKKGTAERFLKQRESFRLNGAVAGGLSVAGAESVASMSLTAKHQQQQQDDAVTVSQSYRTDDMASSKGQELEDCEVVSVHESVFEGNSAGGDSGVRGEAKSNQLMTMMKFWISTPFIIGVVVAAFVIHILVWLGLNFIEPDVYFDFTKGCGLSSYRLGAAAFFSVLYLLAQLIMGLLLLTVRDTWYMRYEIYINFTQWFISVAVFVASSLIPLAWLVDSYFPYGNVIYLSSFIDSVISCFVPVVASFVLQRSSRKAVSDQESGNAYHNELRELLHSKRLRDLFKTFTVESFAPESLLCWEFIERFKTIKSRRRRFRFAKELLDTFLSSSSDLQINLPAGFKLEEYMANLAEKESNVPIHFFDKLQTHCEVDLIDMFRRFKHRRAYQKAKFRK